jgi:RND superfamily putative drug exporter
MASGRLRSTQPGRSSFQVVFIAVFGAFTVGRVVLVKAVGLGLALAVAMDATVVRVVAVRALMRLLGDLNWWAPGR